MIKQNITISLLILIALLALGFVLINKKAPEAMPVEETNNTSQGKIDINAVCEGALAYMTFTDGASAEAFVTECKNGEHPEVIERWKADMNISSDVAI
jgi:hypothetical protein